MSGHTQVDYFMQEFSVELIHQKLGGPFLVGHDKILLFDKALKFELFFQKFSIEIMKNMKIN